MRSLLLSLFCIPLLGLSHGALAQGGGFRAPESLGIVGVANMPNGFAVIKDGKVNHIESDCLDSTLRKMTFAQRNQYILKGGSFEVNQANTKEYTLKSVANLKGGGLLGAKIGAWVGKGVVYLGSYGVIGVVSLCTGPAAGFTFAALTAAYAVPIEAASMAGAIAGGIVGGVATGPV